MWPNLLLTPLTFYWLSGMIGNVLNWGFNLLLVRSLSLEDYGVVALFLSFQFLASIPATALQTTINKFAALAKRKKEIAIQISGLQWFSWLLGVSLGLGYLLFAHLIDNFFNLPHDWILTLLIVNLLVWFFPLCWARGIINARQFYIWSGVLILVEGLIKFLIGGLNFYLSANVRVATLAIPASLAGTLFVAWMLIFKLKIKFPSSPLRSVLHIKNQIWKFLGFSLFLNVGMTLLYNIDLLLVKHFFSSTEAGVYAMLSLIGKLIFFLTYSLSGLLIPVLSARLADHRPTKSVLYQVVGLVSLIAAGVVLILHQWPEIGVRLLVGSNYHLILPYLWRYSLAISLLSITVTISIYYLIIENHWYSMLLTLTAIGEAVGIWLFHKNLFQVVMVVFVSMSLMTSLAILMHLFQFPRQKLVKTRTLIK